MAAGILGYLLVSVLFSSSQVSFLDYLFALVVLIFSRFFERMKALYLFFSFKQVNVYVYSQAAFLIA